MIMLIFYVSECFQEITLSELNFTEDHNISNKQNSPNKTWPEHECDTCGRTYFWIRNLRRHKLTECGIKAQFKCPHCSYESKHKHNLVRHMYAKHTENG